MFEIAGKVVIFVSGALEITSHVPPLRTIWNDELNIQFYRYHKFYLWKFFIFCLMIQVVTDDIVTAMPVSITEVGSSWDCLCSLTDSRPVGNFVEM